MQQPQPRKRSNLKQKEWLLERLHANKEMARDNQANSEVVAFWASLAEELNRMGCSRTAQQWQHIWNTWVVKTKGRARKLKITIGGTGGGPAGADLTEEDKKVLEIVGSASVEGFSDLEVGLPLPGNSTLTLPEEEPPAVRETSSPPHIQYQGSPTGNQSPRNIPRRRRRQARPTRPPVNEGLVNALLENGRLQAESIVRAAEIIAAAITSLRSN